MDKAARRQKRREKDRVRERTHAIATQRFDHETGNYRDAVQRLYRLAQKEYPSLFKVVEIDSQLRIRDQNALDHCGLGKQYKTINFETPVDDGYDDFIPEVQGDFSMGGLTQAVVDDKGHHGTVVLMKRSASNPKNSDITNIALFLHELGHVDDFAKGINWAVGKSMDMEALEFYAHEFACRRMMQGNFILPLTFYIEFGVEQLVAASVPSISQAALRFKQSPMYKECLQFIAPCRGSFKK